MVAVQLLAYSHVSDCLRFQTKLSESSLKAVVLDVSNIVSTFHIMVAISKSLLNEYQGSMKTADFKSEVLYNLSVSGRITETAMQFGPKEDSTRIVVAIVHKDDSDNEMIIDNIRLHEDSSTAAIIYNLLSESCPPGDSESRPRTEDAGDLCSSFSEDKLTALKTCYKLTDEEIVGKGFAQLEQIIITKVAVKNL